MSNAKSVDALGEYIFKVHVDSNDFLWRWSPERGLWVMEDVVGLQVSTCRDWLHELTEGGIEVSNTPTGLMRSIPDAEVFHFLPASGTPTDDYRTNRVWISQTPATFCYDDVVHTLWGVGGVEGDDWSVVVDKLTNGGDVLLHGDTDRLMNLISRYYGDIGFVNVNGSSAKSIRSATMKMVAPVVCVSGKHSPEDVKKMPRGYSKSLVVAVKDEFKDYPGVIHIADGGLPDCSNSDFFYAINWKGIKNEVMRILTIFRDATCIGDQTGNTYGVIPMFADFSSLDIWLWETSVKNLPFFTRNRVRISFMSIMENFRDLRDILDDDADWSGYDKMDKFQFVVARNETHGFDHPRAPTWMCYYKKGDATLRWKHNPHA